MVGMYAVPHVYWVNTFIFSSSVCRCVLACLIIWNNLPRHSVIVEYGSKLYARCLLYINMVLKKL
jgi:hypothetical protein